jgi:DNA mismatch endonuclease, patch repair protein
MTDHISPSHRSWNMSRIRSKNTKPERVVRSMLFSLGFRFRINRKDLPGRPDIVLPRYKSAIFIHGCFWHRHNCKDATMPKSNTDFWEKKFAANVERDSRVKRELKDLGWKVITVWSCELKDMELLKQRLVFELKNKEMLMAAEKKPRYGDYETLRQ